MTPQEFQQYMHDGKLTPRESEKAWRLYKTEGPEAAFHFAQSIVKSMKMLRDSLTLRTEPVAYSVWGEKYIDHGALDQMAKAARLPIALAGALMPDAHQGYGLPIGGVLATENAVIPYAVGVDIACRMMLTIYPAAVDVFRQTNSSEFGHLKKALIENTVFGSGEAGLHDGKIEHPVLEEKRWTGTSLLRSLRQTAICQIGTSGTGNHFVEWGELEISAQNNPWNLSCGSYLALLSHSGSRGVGYKIANHFTQFAMAQMADLDQSVKHLAWLPLDSVAGQEYWDAMNLAGEFASANHQVIHERIAKAVGLTCVATIENHHNFAWRETIVVNGLEKEAIVHRKGATPAGAGILGIIPATMADPGYVVMGKGNSKSLNSASHGSGRKMSRKGARQTILPAEQADYLAKHKVTLIGGGLDEAPQAYKQIEEVMEAQSDLVAILGKFQPRIVRMAEEEGQYKRKPVPAGIVDAEVD